MAEEEFWELHQSHYQRSPKLLSSLCLLISSWGGRGWHRASHPAPVSLATRVKQYCHIQMGQ